MLFNTLEFAVFFAVTFALYYLPPLRKWQLGTLLLASMVFYAWSAPWLLVLLFSAVITNAIASYQVVRDRPHARVWALGGVVFNLGVLGLFKYGGLLLGFGVRHLGLPSIEPVRLLMFLPLPLGISFYTFEGISLVTDTFRADRSGGKTSTFIPDSFWVHLSRTSLFIVFFPHLISGPILKARQFYPQIGPKLLKEINWEVVVSAGIVGFFLKNVVADNLKDQTAFLAFPMISTMSAPNGLLLLFGYSMQIFADFAGYSLIAICLAALLGYQLPANFNFPYIARSLAEFWRRWHISLSTWLRDYLYFPLGGNRKGAVRTYFNLAVVMILGGLWHGAAWSFAFWGAFHGIGLALERLLGLSTDEGPDPSGPARLVAHFRRLGVFAYVTFGWLFFKLTQIHQAFDYVKIMSRANHHVDRAIAFPILLYSLPVILYHLAHLPATQAWWGRVREASPQTTHRLRVAALAVLFFFVLTNGGSVGTFIYFQF